MGEIKLLHCPCCKGFSVVDREDVFCTECGLNIKIHDFIYRGEAENYEKARRMAIEQWNTRKPMQEIVERLEEERTLLKEERQEAIEYDDEQIIFATNNQIRAFDYSIRVVKEVGGLNG